MMYLQRIFETPRAFDRDVEWDGYTVYDAAGLLLRYLKCLPEPVIPYDCFSSFVALMVPKLERTLEGSDTDAEMDAVECAYEILQEVPSYNRTLFMYLLDLLFLFSSDTDEDTMDVHTLVDIFQPSILSAAPSSMDADFHLLASRLVVLLVKNYIALSEWQQSEQLQLIQTVMPVEEVDTGGASTA